MPSIDRQQGEQAKQILLRGIFVEMGGRQFTKAGALQCLTHEFRRMALSGLGGDRHRDHLAEMIFSGNDQGSFDGRDLIAQRKIRAVDQPQQAITEGRFPTNQLFNGTPLEGWLTDGCENLNVER